MTKIEFSLKTADGDINFEIVKLEGKFHIFNKFIDFNGKNKIRRVGQTATWHGVVTIAKIFIGKQVSAIHESKSQTKTTPVNQRTILE